MTGQVKMKILICTDGSDQAENAVEFGGLIAAACQAETDLLGITQHKGEEDAIFDSLKRGQKLLKDLNLDAETVSKVGDPVDEIVNRTEKTDYDLVVIGAVRKGIRGPFMMSAKAYRIIKAVEPPVLVVMGSRKSLKRILVCSGAYKHIVKAVEFVGQIAKVSGAYVTLFHVIAEPPALYADLIRLEEDVDLLLKSNSALGQTLQREKEMLEKIGVDNELRLRHGLVTREILREVRRGDYDLIVAGSSRGRGMLSNYILGGVTHELLNRAECPVLVVRSEEPTVIGRAWKRFAALLGRSSGSSKSSENEKSSD